MTTQKKKSLRPESDRVQDIESKLEAKVLRFLSYKARSIKETTDAAYKYIKRYELSPQVKDSLVAGVIESMRTAGYLDDTDYALSYVKEQKRRASPRGPYYIAQFLRSKGVSRELITETLKNNYSPQEEEDCIQKLVEKKAGKEKNKLINYLLRRGFSSNIVYSVVDRNSKSN